MKKLIKPARLLFCFFIVGIFFVAGMYLAKLVGAGKSQGLAGGAIVLFYGLVSAVIAFIISLVVASRLSHRAVVRINRVLAILFFLLASLLAYRIINLDKNEDPVNDYSKKPTSLMPDKHSLYSYNEFKEASGEDVHS